MSSGGPVPFQTQIVLQWTMWLQNQAPIIPEDLLISQPVCGPLPRICFFLATRQVERISLEKPNTADSSNPKFGDFP
jgi:hypothetical protein